MWPEILVGIGEWLGVTEAGRGMSRCRSIGDSHVWTQARPDAAKTIRIWGRVYSRRSPPQMLEHRERECSRCFDVGEVGGVLEDHEPRVWDPVGERGRVAWGRGRVVGAGDH